MTSATETRGADQQAAASEHGLHDAQCDDDGRMPMRTGVSFSLHRAFLRLQLLNATSWVILISEARTQT